MNIFKPIEVTLAVLMSAVFFSGCVFSINESNSDSASYAESSNFNSSSSQSSALSTADNNDNTPDEEEGPAYVKWMLEEKVHEIRIEMSPDDWKTICSNPYSGDYHPADVTIDGVSVKNVGIRTRGHGSLYMATEGFPASKKFPLKIKFDKYEKDQSFMGLDELALNNGGDDYSMMRDYMGYEAFRLLGSDASCVTFFNVYLNGELRGFYVGVEAIDTSYLERMFGSHKNNLYEGESGASLTTYMPLANLTQKKGKDESKADVKQLIDTLNKMPLGEKGEIESILDVDSVLRVLAVNAVLDNRDGYGGMFAHNYYLYNNNGKFVMLPWDMNAPRVSSWTDIATPTMGVEGYSFMNTRPLAKKLVAVDEYYAIYLDYCTQLTEKLPELKEKVLRAYGMVKESVENDKNKFCSNYLFNYQFEDYNGNGITYFFDKRYAYLKDRLAQLEGKPASSEVLNPPPPPPPATSSAGQSQQPEDTEAPSGEQTGEPEDKPNSEEPASSTTASSTEQTAPVDVPTENSNTPEPPPAA